MSKQIFSLRAARRGFSVLEVILGTAMFAVFSGGIITLLLQGLETDRLAEEESIAGNYASEGLEALRSMKNQSFALLSGTGGAGVDRVGANGTWAFSGASTSFGKYVRTVSVLPVARDGSGNIVTTGGTPDPLSWKVTSAVTWPVSSARTNTITLESSLTDWQKPLSPNRGMLVYGDGGTTTDAIRYRIFSGDTNVWSAVSSVADIDTGTTNRVARAISLFSSSTRDEKILLSRHANGTTQYIYGQVWNGSSWGDVQLLANWNNNTFLDAQNFDGAYLSNGDFLAVFGDNTTTPKSRVWNGSSWSGAVSLRALSGIPSIITVRARPGTNEAMAAFFNQASDTQTEYFGGGAYQTSSWTLHATHSAVAPSTALHRVDFSWSAGDSFRGAIVYPDSATDRANTVKVFTANGTGSGAWSAAANASNQGVTATRLGATAVVASPLSALFLSCNKDTRNDIYCFRADSTPLWTTPTNNIVTTTSSTGAERSFHLAYERASGDALLVYSDNTSIPKLRKYAASTNVFDASATSLSTLSGVARAIRLVPSGGADDIAIVAADANRRVSTQFWDGSALGSSGARGLVTHGTSGVSTTAVWFDFAWDGM